MKLVKYSLHIERDSVGEFAEAEGLSDEQATKLITALYEVDFLVDVETGTIHSVNGKILDHCEPRRNH